MAIEKLKNRKSPDTDQIPCGIDSSRRQDKSLGDMLINSVGNKEELPEEWKESIVVPIYKKGDKTDCSN